MLPSTLANRSRGDIQTEMGDIVGQDKGAFPAHTPKHGLSSSCDVLLLKCRVHGQHAHEHAGKLKLSNVIKANSHAEPGCQELSAFG